MSSRLETRDVRPAQYRSIRSVGSSGSIAEQYVITSPVPTVRPAARSSREKSTSSAARGARSAAVLRSLSAACSGTGRDLCQVAAHKVEVVPVLDHGAEG